MILIKPSTVSYDVIELKVGIFPFTLLTQFFGSDKQVSKFSGRAQYSNCVIESDEELCIGKKFNHQFKEYMYFGILPINQNNNQWECIIDYFERVEM